jgi:hypothetical protein
MRAAFKTGTAFAMFNVCARFAAEGASLPTIAADRMAAPAAAPTFEIVESTASVV